MKSQAAEKAIVELINKFVSLIEFDALNRKGQRQFQLPLSEITPENWRKEEALPIDKFDWISFEKIFRPVAVFPDSERSYYCNLYTIIYYY